MNPSVKKFYFLPTVSTSGSKQTNPNVTKPRSISSVEPVTIQMKRKEKQNRTSGSKQTNPNVTKPRSSSLSKTDNVMTTHTRVKPRTNIDSVAVTNLSQHPLNECQISLLSRGLKFIPDRHKVDKLKLLADLTEWERRMRLREFFYAEGTEPQTKQDKNDPSEKFKVPKKSSFTPNKGRDMWLDMYIEMVKTDITNSLQKLGKLNISPGENDAFLSLLHNDDIVIRPADKGSGIVVLDKVKYIQSLQKEMEESDSYDVTDEDQTKKSLREVKKLVNKMYRDGAISKDIKQFLIPRYPKAGSLKGNPKLHKNNAPMRTIVNGMNTATEKLAELAEYELNEYVITSPSYIRDTTDFINTLKEIDEPLPEGIILFCFDVCKLYPSVPKQEGLEACREGLNSRSRSIVPTEEVLKMIKVVLDNNNFNLGNKHYIQTNGIAIGSKLGKNFACSYMRKWDEKLMEYHEQPFFYKRFIDDGFGLWTGSVDTLEKFAEYANGIHRNIKIELRYSREKIEFLDTWVHMENGRIYTSLYRKPTDKQLYLHKTSNHPPSTKSGLAYGLGLRLRRICEKQKDYQVHRRELKVQLRKRGYSGKDIEKQLHKVDTLKREDLLSVKSKEKKEDRVPLVLTFSRHLPDIHKIVRKHLPVLHRSDRMTEVFQKPPIVAYRRDKNLADTLVHGKTNKALKQKDSTCSCKICNAMHREEIWSSTRDAKYKTAENPSCSDRNIVYALICCKCDKTVYVGETERTLKERTDEHLRDVRQQVEKPIMRHFEGHKEEQLRVTILQRMFQEGRIYRQLAEEQWIMKLKTKIPQGCNVKLN